MSPVEDTTCHERMKAQNETIQIMFTQIREDVHEIKSDLKEMNSKSAGYVSWDAFREKCREIEDMKKFVWMVSGGLSLASFLVGLAVKFLK